MADDVQALALRYQAALHLEDWPTAEDTLRNLLDHDPANPALHFNLGLVLKRLSRADEAIAQLRNTLTLAGGHHNARFELATALLELGDYQEAGDLLAVYCKAVPFDAEGLLNYGLVLLRTADAQAALAALHKAHQLAERDDIELALAEAERDCGKLDEAIARLQALVTKTPAARPAAIQLLTQGSSSYSPLEADRLLGPER